MTYAPESDMAFARAIDYAIDKEEFWQLSSTPPPASGALDACSYERQRGASVLSSDFYDQYVVMDMDGPEASTHSPSESLFDPHHHGHELNLDELDYHEPGLDEEGDGSSPPASASSAAEPFSVTSAASSHTGEDHQSVDMISATTSIPSVDGSTKSISLSTNHIQHPRQGQTGPRQEQQIAGGDPASHSADLTNHIVLGRLDRETLEQRKRLLSGRRGLDKPMSGSISDSELLRLEGLSVNSPRGLVGRVMPSSTSAPSITSTTSTTPPLSAHGLPVPVTTSNSNHRGGSAIVATADDIDLCSLAKSGGKHNFRAGSRKFESIYSTIRRAVGGRGRIAPQHPQQHPKTAPIPQTVIPSHMESAKKATRRLASESQLMWDGLPISPPLTDMAHPSHSHGSDTAVFVAGMMDDPFFDPTVPFNHDGSNAGLAPAAQINGKGVAYNATIPNTPLHTPTLKNDGTGDDTNNNYFPTTSGPWSMDGNTHFVTSMDMSNSASYLSGDGTVVDAWHFDPASEGGSNMDFTTTGGNSSHGNHVQGIPPSSRNHHNLTIQVPRYNSLAHDPHHTPGSDSFANSGLMIHMPQPRTPSTAPLLSSQVQQSHNGTPLHEATMFPFPEGTPHQTGSMHSFRGAYTDHGHHSSRRPKPRAPSSGARYHQLGLSPRKVRQSSSSSSSPSPTPGQANGGGGGGSGSGGGANGRRSRSMSRRQGSMSFTGGSSGSNNNNTNNNNALSHRKSTTDLISVPSSDMQSHAIRKRRSTSSWRGSRRSTSGPSSSAAAATAATMGDSGMGGISLGGGDGSGGAQIGFVNYTPNDHTVLMTGVAPSGSSKTKMRREKEAMERQRKLSEAVVKAVTAAGVDVSRLKEEGIMI